MTNIKFKSFTDPNVLKTINARHLAQFFDLFKNGLPASDRPAPGLTPGSGPYLDAWAALLKSPEKLSQSFIQAIQVIENLASPEHRTNLEAAVQEAIADNAPLDPKASPECLALQIWLWARYGEHMLLDPNAIVSARQALAGSNSDEDEPVPPSWPAEEAPGQESLESGSAPNSGQAGPSPTRSINTFHRYRGTIGRLPHEVREQINFMMYDGLPYRAIIEKLGDVGKALKLYHLARWKKTGYSDWLKEQERRELIRAKEQFALDVLLEKDAGKVHEASLQVAASLLCQFLADFDPTSLKEKLQNDPLNFIRLINTLPRLSQSGIKCESHRFEISEHREALQKAKLRPLRVGLSDQTRNFIEDYCFNPPPN